MNALISAAVAGAIAFIATNLDDIVILMIFFARVNSSFRPRHIVIGQYVGFAVLIAASLPGFFGAALIPKAWIGLLGLLPIAIGIRVFFQPSESEVQAISTQTVQRAGFGLLPTQALQVAAVTVANGGDNVGIYLPLFASSHPMQLLAILSVFLILVGVWCWVAYQLARHPIVAQSMTRYGHVLVPFVLIGLGTYILWESGAMLLIASTQWRMFEK